MNAAWVWCLSLLAAPAGFAADVAKSITPARAQSLFVQHCAGCHQLDGSGAPAHGVPSMLGLIGHFQRTEAGRAFLVQAPGARNASISDAELAALTNWEIAAFAQASMPARFIPYSGEEVHRWRSDPPLDVAAARAAIVRAFPAGHQGR
jgi:mono/diheme cytochrome c family protein